MTNTPQKASKLKVYGGNYAGSQRRIVACDSRKQAIELLGVTQSTFNNFFTQTGNKIEVEIATSNPYKVFSNTYKDNNNVYVEVQS